MKYRHILIMLAMAFSLGTHAQEEADYVPFNGMITDALGRPMKNVRIWVKDEHRYALSDKKGRFGLSDVQATDTLHLRWKRLRYEIPVEGRSSMRILISDEPVIEEDQDLVDQGYGYVRRREYTGVSNFISGEELRRSGRNSVLAALQGRVPGLNISTGQFPGSESVTMRGINSLNMDNTPLFIVDGVIVDTLSYLSPFDVESVEILKDASIYGARGANGAILIHTKKGTNRK